MLRRALFGRSGRPWAHRAMKPFLLIALFVLLLGSCAVRADAATVKPVTACGSKVSWSIDFESVAPAGSAAAMAWAYGQVAPVARLQVSKVENGRVRSSYPDPMTGVSSPSGDTWEEGLVSGKYRLHSHRLSGTPTVSTLRQWALRDVLRDLGVASPSSTASGLSVGDRQALRRTCAAQKVTPGTKAGSKPAAKAPVSTSVDTDKAEPRRVSTTPMVAPWVTSVASLIALVLLVGGLVYIARPTLLGRVTALGRAGRGRVAAARKTRRMRVPTEVEDDEAGEQ